MILAIDVGNTQTVIGLYKDEELLIDWRISTVREQTADEYGMLLINLFKSNDFKLKEGIKIWSQEVLLYSFTFGETV